MTPWKWWAGEIDCQTFDLACEASTREDAIREALTKLSPGEKFQIIEARSSTDKCHDDFVPFVRTRNFEVLTADPAIMNGGK